MPKLKIEITGDHTRLDLIVFLREVINALHHNQLNPDIRRPIRNFRNEQVGYAVIESDIQWPDPMTLEDV